MTRWNVVGLCAAEGARVSITCLLQELLEPLTFAEALQAGVVQRFAAGRPLTRPPPASALSPEGARAVFF